MNAFVTHVVNTDFTTKLLGVIGHIVYSNCLFLQVWL